MFYHFMRIYLPRTSCSTVVRHSCESREPATLWRIYNATNSRRSTCETKRYSCECRKTLTNVSQLSFECRAIFVRHICKINANNLARIARNCRINVHSMRLQHENRVSRNSCELVFSCRIPVR